MILKYYNSTLQIGFNFPKEVYDCKNEVWLKSSVHLGRLVYGKQRISYKRISNGIDRKDFEIQELNLPF